MMTAYDDFVDSLNMMMQGFTGQQDQVTHLTEPLTNTDSSVTVFDTSRITAGSTIEVGSELLHVQAVDSGSSTVTFSPFGRGYRGTTAAAHDLNDRLAVSPVVPRFVVERAVDDAVRGTWPQLFGVSTTEFVYTAAKSTYSLPAGAVKVLAVSWDTLGPTEEWTPVRRYRVDANADPTDFASGSSLSIYDPIVPGRTVRVVYTHQPAPFTSGEQFTDTGLQDSAQDVVRYGAAYRLAPWFDVARVPGLVAEQNYAAGLGRTQSGSQLSRFLVQAYQLRLQEEAASLHTLFPIRSHYTR